MSHDDKQHLYLGRMVMRMIADVHKQAPNDRAYARRTITYPGGEVEILIANRSELADLFDRVASGEYDLAIATAATQVN